MGIDFPAAPISGQSFSGFTWDGEKWLSSSGGVPTRAAIYAAPFDALAYSGLQINGSIDVSQELGTVGFVLSGVTGKYAADGWVAACNLGVGQLSAKQQPLAAEVPGLKNCLQVVTSTAQATLTGTNYVRFICNIEGYRFARVAWGTSAAVPVTVGFWARATLPGSYRAVLLSADSSGNTGWVSFTLAGGAAFQWITLTFPAQTTGTWNTDNTIGAQLLVEMASTATPNLLATVNNYASITGVVVLPGLEAPSAARSALIMRPYDQELATCKRYWEQNRLYHTGYGLAGSAAAGMSMQYPVEKRVIPTLTQQASNFINCSANTVTPGAKMIVYIVNVAANGQYVLDVTLNSDARLT